MPMTNRPKEQQNGPQEQPKGLTKDSWDILLKRIKGGQCTPFLGAEACKDALRLEADIAREWAQEYDYPLEDCTDLSRVAQFLAVERDALFPKDLLLERIKEAKPPDFDERDEIHGLLAELPLPIYLTTNYDDFMFQALQRQGKRPEWSLCRWNKAIAHQPCVFDTDFEPHQATPIVYHLHGHHSVPQSLVLAEDDYVDFLIAISQDEHLIPPRIEEAFTMTSLLFLGYSLSDWNFRVIFRRLVSYLEKSVRPVHICVQLEPFPDGIPKHQKERARRYLEKYFNLLDIRIYWGTCREFAAELRGRLQRYRSGK